MMKKEKVKVYIYTRVSTAMQIDGYSLDAQKSRMKAYAEFNDYEIVGEYEDAGKSGKSIEGRVEFNRRITLKFILRQNLKHSFGRGKIIQCRFKRQLDIRKMRTRIRGCRRHFGGIRCAGRRSRRRPGLAARAARDYEKHRQNSRKQRSAANTVNLNFFMFHCGFFLQCPMSVCPVQPYNRVRVLYQRFLCAARAFKQ